MNKQQLKQLSTALIPFALLLLMMLFFLISVKSYFRCETKKCESISENLNKVLPPVESNDYEILPEDNAENKKKNAENKKKKELQKQEVTALRYSGRLTFTFLANLYFFICLTAAGISVYIIYQALKKDKFFAKIVLAVIIGISTIVGVYLLLYLDIYLAVFNPLFEKIKTDLPQAKDLMIWVNSFGFAVCAMLCLAIGTILYLPLSRKKDQALLEAEEKMNYLRMILYLSTVMLIVGMLIVRSVYQWSLAFTSREIEAVKTAEAFFANLITVEGAFSTVVLAVSYLPAMLIVRWQIDGIDGLPQRTTEKEAELQKYHLTFSFTESLPRIIAILGPMLAGPIGDLFTKFIK